MPKAKTKKEEPTNKESDLKRQVGRIVSNSYYDMQELRIATVGRIRDLIRKKVEGIAPDQTEEKKEEEEEEEDRELEKYTDAKLNEYLNEALNAGKLTPREHEYVEKCLSIAEESVKIEKQYQVAMMDFIKDEPVYNQFLAKVKGIGPVLSANLIKNFGYCEHFEAATKLWAYTGNAVMPDGKAPKKRAGVEVNYNPKLRTLTWKISDCLMKANKGIYRQVYETEKAKQLVIQYGKGELEAKYGKPYKTADVQLSKLHAHNRALRKMRKLFLAHYFECTKELTGQPVREAYVSEKLGHTSIISWHKALTLECDKPKRVKKDKVSAAA